jgi:signal transduction histidine kinase
LNRYILLSTYLVVMGFLLGYLAEAEKLLRSEIAAIARIMRKAQEEPTLAKTLQVISDEVLRVFGTNLAFFVMRETFTERVFLWEAQRSEDTNQTRLRTSEVEAARRETYFFAAAAKSMHSVVRKRGHAENSFEFLALDESGRRLLDIASNAPAPLNALHPFRSLLYVSFTSGDEWSGRLYLINPSSDASSEVAIGFLRALLFQLAPAVYNVYLLRRIRSRVGAIERTRIAREIHDGPIQSLIGLEMQVDVLRRQATTAQVAQDLDRIQQLLRHEVLGLRELMQEIKPLDVGPKQLVGFLEELVERFGRETGISAKFVHQVEEVSLTPRACREIARIVQEALVNVRKHSEATNVFVQLLPQAANYKLEIDDDGRGFDFAGRYSQAQLDAIQKGPVVIKERVRSIGGELVIESNPGRGVRLEIAFPQRLYG